MARRKPHAALPWVERTPTPFTGHLQDAELFDADGTLWDVTGIRPLIDGPGGYHAFHAASVDCPPNPEIVAAAQRAHARGRAVVLVTAREAIWRHHTAWWLPLNGVPTDCMAMRGVGDYRPDYEVKRDIARILMTMYRFRKAWDDNPNVLQLWKELGIPYQRVPGWTGPVPPGWAA